MSLVRINGYPMDLALSEGHSFPGAATEFPVEAGADISDHIRELPTEITLECIVSDTPIGEVATDPTRQPQTGPDGTTTQPLPSTDALARLREIKALRKPVRVETTLGVFESMAFIDLTVPVEAAKSPGHADPDPQKARAGALFFTAKFKKIVIVTNRRTKVRTRSSMAGSGGQGKNVTKVAKVYKIVKTVKWFHGSPPGAPWRDPNPIELVKVGFATPKGVPANQVPSVLDETLRYTELGYANDNVQFTDAKGVQIVGDRLNALRLDLLRDRRDADAARDRDPAFHDPRFGPDGQLLPKAAKNLPTGISTNNWSLPDNAPPPGFITQDQLPTGPPIEG
jgi:hypothetical protein